MTDNELKELVEGLAVSQAKTAEEMKVYFEESRAQLMLMFEKTDAQILKTDMQMLKTDAKMVKTDEKLKSMGIHIGGMANSNGYSTEEYFFNSLEDDKRLGTLKFDEISRNLHYKLPNLEDEFDITMFNRHYVNLISG